MDLPANAFRRALAEGRPQIGLWCSIPGGYVAEALATLGYDWILFDCEHAPNDPLGVLPQLQAAAPYGVSAVVRPSWNDAVQVKRLLDSGAQTLLIPYVQTPEEAEAAAAAIRYAPAGMRGVAGLTRANRFGLVEGYARRAEEELCLLVQAETATSLERLEEIAAVDGVDGVFIGPSDLAASLGHVGEPMHPEVVAAVEDAIRRLVAAGTPAGILTTDEGFARRCLDLGALFVAVGTDLGLLLRAGRELRGRFAG